MNPAPTKITSLILCISLISPTAYPMELQEVVVHEQEMAKKVKVIFADGELEVSRETIRELNSELVRNFLQDNVTKNEGALTELHLPSVSVRAFKMLTENKLLDQQLLEKAQALDNTCWSYSKSEKKVKKLITQYKKEVLSAKEFLDTPKTPNPLSELEQKIEQRDEKIARRHEREKQEWEETKECWKGFFKDCVKYSKNCAQCLGCFIGYPCCPCYECCEKDETIRKENRKDCWTASSVCCLLISTFSFFGWLFYVTHTDDQQA